jgi:hypothetical protein
MWKNLGCDCENIRTILTETNVPQWSQGVRDVIIGILPTSTRMLCIYEEPQGLYEWNEDMRFIICREFERNSGYGLAWFEISRAEAEQLLAGHTAPEADDDQ